MTSSPNIQSANGPALLRPLGPAAQASPPREPSRRMSKEAPLSAAERDFILEALQQGVRLDGRALDELRPLSISFGDEYGHVKVQLGKTQ